MKKVHWETKSRLYIYVLSFENINMFAKGNYRIRIEAFIDDQKCTIESETKAGRSSELGKKQNQQYFTKEYNVRFQNEKVQLNELLIIESPSYKVCKESKILIKLTLLKAESIKTEGSHTQYIPIKNSFWMVRFVMNSFCQYTECTFNEPFLSTLSAIIFNQPFSTSIQTKQYKYSDEQQLLALKKQIKKVRYNNYVLCNKFKKIFYGNFAIQFSLPRMFVTGQKDMAQVVADQEHLLNYLIMYETISLTPQQMSIQLVSIDQKSENMFKIFKQNCEKNTIYLNKLKMEYEQKQSKRYKQYISREEYNARYFEQYKPILKDKLKILNRQTQIYMNDQTINNLIFKPQNVYEQTKPFQLPIYPVIIQETQILTAPKESQHHQSISAKSKTRYLLVLAHGYQGCPQDLIMIANGFKRKYKKTKYISLKSYKNKMGQSIQQMANSAVQEINSYLDCMDFKEKNYRIIMIGHSMGGLVLRLAANKINYQEYLWGFISLGTPHLGYLQGMKLLIRAGLSIFSNIYSTPCLDELAAKDAEELHDTEIYRMSVQGHLGNFKRVILISSSKDKYVSWHSARIQNFNKDRLKQFTFIQNQMICNILGKQPKIQRIDRLQVDFKILESNMDKIIGRTCHIKFLTDVSFIQLLCNSCLPQILQM